MGGEPYSPDRNERSFARTNRRVPPCRSLFWTHSPTVRDTIALIHTLDECARFVGRACGVPSRARSAGSKRLSRRGRIRFLRCASLRGSDGPDTPVEHVYQVGADRATLPLRRLVAGRVPGNAAWLRKKASRSAIAAGETSFSRPSGISDLPVLVRLSRFLRKITCGLASLLSSVMLLLVSAGEDAGEDPPVEQHRLIADVPRFDRPVGIEDGDQQIFRRLARQRRQIRADLVADRRRACDRRRTPCANTA